MTTQVLPQPGAPAGEAPWPWPLAARRRAVRSVCRLPAVVFAEVHGSGGPRGRDTGELPEYTSGVTWA